MKIYYHNIILYLTLLLTSVLVNDISAQVNTTLNFICQGNFIEIGDNKYYDGDMAFLCDGSVLTYSSDMTAFHADGTIFPMYTDWEGVSLKDGPNATIYSNNVSSDINGLEVKAFYQGGNGQVSITIHVVFIRLALTEDSGQLYGFDPNGEKEQYYPSYSTEYVWKSLELGQTDPIVAEMLPSGLFEYVTFTSSDPDNFLISPINP